MHVETVKLKFRQSHDKRGSAELKLLDALKRIDLNGAGVLKASIDDDASRIVAKKAAFKSALEDLEEAWQDIWFRHDCNEPIDPDEPIIITPML